MTPTETEQTGANRDLSGEVVAITGASRGLGAALALAFASAGAAVSLCARSGAGLERLADGIRSEGGRVHAQPADIRSAVEVGGWIEATRDALGAPSVLVNNASVLGPRVPLAEHGLDEWRETMEINVTGSFIVAQAVIPGMMEAGGGQIIQLSSGAAIVPRKEWGSYSISKLAADGLAMNLAAELEPHRIRVNIVDPGAMRTGMRAAAYPAEDPMTLKTPEETVEIFLWLAAAGPQGPTGQRYRADRWQARR